MSQTPAKTTEISLTDRFNQAVMREYATATGIAEFSPEQKRQVTNYFLRMEAVLAENEIRRLNKPEASRDPLEFSWKNINFDKFAQEVAIYALLKLDPIMPNHVNLILFKNSKTNKYDVSFIRGYKGLEIVARQFGVNPPVEVITELVYSNDEYQPIKKDMDNGVETYKFKVTNPFNRGELQGGFIYMRYEDPKLNTIESLSVAEIEKRKPKYASAEFWGGEKDLWKDGKRNGKEVVEGWYTEMMLKTLKRKAWNSVTIDGMKINDQYVKMEQIETVAEVQQTTVDAEVIEEQPLQITAQAVETIPVAKEAEKQQAKTEKQEPIQANTAFDFPPAE